MIVQRVQSNIKGGVDVELGELTLVVGPSASNKTSIWNSIELPFLGGCSDVGVYDWRAKDRDLLDMLAPPEAAKLWSKITLDDGTVCTVEIERNKKTGGAKSAVYDVPIKAELPVTPFREGLRGSSAGIRTFLLQRMTGGITDKDVLDRVPGDQHEAFKLLWKSEQGADDNPVDLLLAVLASAKLKATAAKKARDTAEGVATSLSQGLSVQPTTSDLKAAQAALDAATLALQQAPQVQAKSSTALTGMDVKAIYTDAHAKVTHFQSLDVHLQSVEAQLGTSTPATEQANALVSALVIVMNAHLHSPAAACGVCSAPISSDTKAWMETQRDGLVSTAQLAVQRANLAEQAKTLRTEHALAKQQAEAAVANYTQAKTAFEIAPVPVPVDNEAHYEAVADLNTANTEFSQLKAIAAAWEQVASEQGKTVAFKDEQAKWEALRDGCTVAIGKLMDHARETFVMRVNESLPEGKMFDLLLERERGGKTVEVCEFGLVKEGHLRTAISGAELGQVIAAMTAATLPDKAEGPILVTLPKDVGMDRQALRATMSALAPLRKRGVQVVIFSVLIHAGKKPAHWTIVSLDAEGNAKTTKATT
jgi:hypothetical protein